MSFWSDIAVNAQAFARAAGTKANELAELTRVRMNMAGLNRSLDEKLVELGRLTYRARVRGQAAEAEQTVLCEEVTALMKERRALQEQVEQLKKVSICPECGAENPIASTYCAKCGEKL